MATTKIWPIREGSSMKLVIDYVENPDKTTERVYTLEINDRRNYTYEEKENMTDVMEYAMNDYKTNEKKLVSGVNVSVEHARDEMMLTKRQYGKENGIILWHGYQSFKPGEVTADEAHMIGVKLAENLWGEDYEVIVCTHIDKEHIHNHFVINSVSFRTGKKLDAKWQDMAKESDALCRLYGKSIVENPKYNGKHYAQWLAEKNGEGTWSSFIRKELDEIIDSCYSIESFFMQLQEKHWQIKPGKYLSLKPPGKERFIRVDRHFGPDYSVEGITARIEANVKNNAVKIPMEKGRRIYRCRNSVQKPRQKIGGYQGLYYFYCYKLGVLPKRHVSTKRTHYLLREELRYMDKIADETRFLAKNHITAEADLKHYEENLSNELTGLRQRRQIYYNQKRTMTGTDKKEVESRILNINKTIKSKNKELHMVNDIKERSKKLQEKARSVREMDNPGNERKETEIDEIQKEE